MKSFKVDERVECKLMLTPGRLYNIRGTVAEVESDGHVLVDIDVPSNWGGSRRLRVDCTKMRHLSLLELIAEAAT